MNGGDAVNFLKELWYVLDASSPPLFPPAEAMAEAHPVPLTVPTCDLCNGHLWTLVHRMDGLLDIQRCFLCNADAFDDDDARDGFLAWIMSRLHDLGVYKENERGDFGDAVAYGDAVAFLNQLRLVLAGTPLEFPPASPPVGRIEAAADPNDPANLIPLADVLARYRITRQTLDRWMKAHAFPRPVKKLPGLTSAIFFWKHDLDALELKASSKESQTSDLEEAVARQVLAAQRRSVVPLTVPGDTLDPEPAAATCVCPCGFLRHAPTRDDFDREAAPHHPPRPEDS